MFAATRRHSLTEVYDGLPGMSRSESGSNPRLEQDYLLFFFAVFFFELFFFVFFLAISVLLELQTER